MHKDKLKGHHVTYIDKDGKFRTGKVVRIVGKTLTVANVFGEKTRIHPDKRKIFGRQLKKKIEEIQW